MQLRPTTEVRIEEKTKTVLTVMILGGVVAGLSFGFLVYTAIFHEDPVAQSPIVSESLSEEQQLPIVNILYPVAGEVLVVDSFEPIAVATDQDGIAHVTFTLDGIGAIRSVPQPNMPFHYIGTKSPIVPGSYALQATAQNRAGQTATSDVIRFTVE